MVQAMEAEARHSGPASREPKPKLELVPDQPLVGARAALADLVMAAESDEEFVDLLRRIQQASGRTPGKIARYSEGKLPRPTAYDLIKLGRRTMPTKREQVEAFGSGAGLSPLQVLRLLSVWDRLRDVAEQAKAEQAKARSEAATPPAPTASASLVLSGQGRVLEGVLVNETGAPAVCASQDLVPPAGAEQVMPEDFTGIAGSVNTLVVHGNLNVHHEQNERHEAGDQPRGATNDRDDQDERGDAKSARRHGLLMVALRNGQMFRRLLLLLAFAAVVLLGVTGMVVVALSGLSTSYVMFPLLVTVAAVVVLTRQAHGLRSGLTDVLRDSQPAERRYDS